MPKEKIHPIRRYCDAQGITQVDIADKLGCNPQLITDVIMGRCHLGRLNMLELVKVTGGKITLEDLLTWPALRD